MVEILISYDLNDNQGSFSIRDEDGGSIWQRLISSALNYDQDSNSENSKIKLPWYQVLTLLREYSPLQRQHGFRFISDSTSKDLVNRFVAESRSTANAARGTIVTLSQQEINQRLVSLGFTKRILRDFQTRDIARLVAIANGANFSVPGAGKTTVSLAIHMLACNIDQKMLVICPKAAFTAWTQIINECINVDEGWPYASDLFMNLSGLDEREISNAYDNPDNHFFFTNYEHFVSKRETFSYLISTRQTHLILDESHRMKAGQLSQRGAALLSISNLPIRKDILSGTPMPQDSSDLQSQLEFLWPGSSLSSRIQAGEEPANVISGLHTRTTKNELGLPEATRHFERVSMSAAQAALYGIIKSETLRQLSSFRDGQGMDIIRARKSVLRLLQIASNPLLAVRGIVNDHAFQDHPVINEIINNPGSPKIEKVCELVRRNVGNRRKTVVWTIFTQNIIDLERHLSDLNPVSLYGEVPSGSEDDPLTREGRLRRFHEDDSCWVIIANPAAAGEGISLHKVCHEAVYLDRSYVSTHYLQSIDRIHRLGLQPGTETNITIVQIAPPIGLGSIDYSVSRRLANKIRALEQLLRDPDLHIVALDEENSQEPVDYAMDVADVADLIEELEGRIPFNESDGI